MNRTIKVMCFEHRGAGRVFLHGSLSPFTDTVGDDLLKRLRDLDREHDDEEAVQQAADVFRRGSMTGWAK